MILNNLCNTKLIEKKNDDRNKIGYENLFKLTPKDSKEVISWFAHKSTIVIVKLNNNAIGIIKDR